VATELTDLNPVDYCVWSILQQKVYGTRFANIDELKCKLLQGWANWITKSLHQRSASGVTVLGPVRPLMEDTLSKPSSEHVRLCVEQIVVPYLGMILLNCFSEMFKIVQFYCYSFRTVK